MAGPAAEAVATDVSGHAFAADVGDEAQLTAVISAATERVGPIDVFVSNAGVGGRQRRHHGEARYEDRSGRGIAGDRPLYHGAPGAWGLQALHHGHSVVLIDRWDSEQVLALIERERLTTAEFAPIHFFRLLNLPEAVRNRYDVSSLTVVSHAGAACPVDVKRRMMDWFGPVLYEYYASSEGFGTSIGPHEWLEHPGSVGQASADGAIMKILDEDGRELGPDEVGTLWIKNPGGLLSEYLNEPAKTAASHRDGFYTAGDQARIDPDGWVYIVDRRVDLILSGGVNIYPAEVERAISNHAAVAEVAVIGAPDAE